MPATQGFLDNDTLVPLRAGEVIRPFAWVVNQSLLPLRVTDPLLVRRRANEARYHAEVSDLAPRVAVVPWAMPRAAETRLDFFAAPERPRAEAAP